MRQFTHVSCMVLVVVLGTKASTTEASILNATLQAVPSSINEGGTTSLKLTLQNTPQNNIYQYQYPSTFYTRAYYTNGSGYINSFTASINPGDGQSSLGLTWAGNGNSYVGSRTAQYLSPGNYTASISGTAWIVDYLKYYYYYYSDGSWSEPHSGGTASHSHSISATTSVHVGNLNPSINHINWDAVVYVDDVVNFSAIGADPYGVGSSESMQFAYDFENDGTYDYVQNTGTGLTSSGTTSYSTPGIYTVRVRVTDHQGGSDYATFDVNVLEHVSEAISAAPEPGSLLVWAGLMATAATRRRD
jgi:hypothetical protein